MDTMKTDFEQMMEEAATPTLTLDFMADEKENVYCLEANTLPGMTPTSLLPQEAAAEGMDYASLCEHIIEISLKKYR